MAAIARHVTIEDFALVGGLVAVHQFCRIGKMSIIGGCSRVYQDVAPFMLVNGNPAETVTINKVGMERNEVPEAAQSALRLDKFEQTVGMKPVHASPGEWPNAFNRPAHELKHFIDQRAESVRRQLDGKFKGMILKYPKKK